jgi:branched-chain amino acid transport system permease protein
LTRFLQAVTDSLSTGSFYALVALGIGLIFGVMRLVNLAYGEIISGSVFAAFLLRSQPTYVIIIGMLVAALLISVLTERFAFRPLRSASPSTMLMASFAVSYTLQNFALATVGSAPREVGAGSSLAVYIRVGSVHVTGYSIMTVAAVVIIVIALRLFLVRTAIGISMRAASEDFECAKIVGVLANRVILTAFLISGVIATIIGYVLAAQTGSATPTLGAMPVLLGFTAVVLGGMGSLPAAALGGLFLGALTVVLQIFLPENLQIFLNAFVFTAVLLLLMLRPQGLFIRKRSAEIRV